MNRITFYCKNNHKKWCRDAWTRFWGMNSKFFCILISEKMRKLSLYMHTLGSGFNQFCLQSSTEDSTLVCHRLSHYVDKMSQTIWITYPNHEQTLVHPLFPYIRSSLMIIHTSSVRIWFLYIELSLIYHYLVSVPRRLLQKLAPV